MTEIERKFRVDRLPDGRRDPVRIEQAYIALDDGVEVRVRRRDGSCSLTVKGGTGLERSEVELDVDAHDADRLWPLANGRTVAKIRSTIDVGKHLAEVDEYEGRLRGLSVVEVEFDDRESAAAFDPPDWFGEEVTGDDEWSNARLAGSDHPPR